MGVQEGARGAKTPKAPKEKKILDLDAEEGGKRVQEDGGGAERGYIGC